MVERNWVKPTTHRPQGVSLAESRRFRLTDFDLDKSDELELWAALIETSALCTRMERKRLHQVRPLANVSSLTPPLSKRPIAELSDFEAAELVDRLRRTAEEKRTHQGADRAGS